MSPQADRSYAETPYMDPNELCRCGHRLSEHTYLGLQPCLGEPYCDCDSFTPKEDDQDWTADYDEDQRGTE